MTDAKKVLVCEDPAFLPISGIVERGSVQEVPGSVGKIRGQSAAMGCMRYIGSGRSEGPPRVERENENGGLNRHVQSFRLSTFQLWEV